MRSDRELRGELGEVMFKSQTEIVLVDWRIGPTPFPDFLHNVVSLDERKELPGGLTSFRAAHKA